MDATRAIQVAVVRADMFIVGFGRFALAALVTAGLWAAWIAFIKKMGWYK